MHITTVLALVATLATSFATPIIGPRSAEHEELSDGRYPKEQRYLAGHPDRDCATVVREDIIDPYFMKGPKKTKGGKCWNFMNKVQSVANNKYWSMEHNCEFELYQARDCLGELLGTSIQQHLYMEWPSCVRTDNNQVEMGAFSVLMKCKKRP